MGVTRTTPSRQQHASASTPTDARATRSRAVASTPASSRKRKATEQSVTPDTSSKKSRRSAPSRPTQDPVEVIDLTGDTPSPARRRARAPASYDEPAPERRARRFRTHPPSTYLDRAARALSQRYAVLHVWTLWQANSFRTACSLSDILSRKSMMRPRYHSTLSVPLATSIRPR